MSVKSHELREKRLKIHAEAAEILKKENRSKEENAKFDGMMAEIDTLGEEVTRIERAEKIELELRETKTPPQDPIHGSQENADEQQRKKQTAIEKRAFRNYLLDGPAGLDVEDRKAMRMFTAAERRDMGIGTNTLGGYFVPQGFVHDVEVALKVYGNMLGESTIMDTATGQPLPYPTENDTAISGELVGEGVQVSDQDVTIGHIVFGAYKFSSKMVKVSLELMQDSAFDIESFLKDAFAIRLARILNTKFTVGAGSTEPYGIVTAVEALDGEPASGGGAVGIPVIAKGAAANDGGSEDGSTSIGSQDLVALEHSIDPLYRPGSKYMMHDQTLKTVKQLLDKYGRPLWLPGVAVNAPDTLNGYAYSINNDMPTIAAGVTTVIFGQLKKYMVRRVKELGVLRLTERFADYGQVAFIGFARYDGNLLDAGTHPVCYLEQASS